MYRISNKQNEMAEKKEKINVMGTRTIWVSGGCLVASAAGEVNATINFSRAVIDSNANVIRAEAWVAAEDGPAQLSLEGDDVAGILGTVAKAVGTIGTPEEVGVAIMAGVAEALATARKDLIPEVESGVE